MTSGGGARGRVAIVGAGPGAADLLTLRALEEIRRAEIVYIDRLVGAEIRALIAPTSEVVEVGKAPGSGPQQDDITQALVDQARRGRRVVRLKGGDPFVFGRGGEEVSRLIQEGTECVVVPGISSALAAPASAGIPVTHRGAASSFCVLTATEADGPRRDWSAASAADTVVVLMGLASVRDVSRGLIDAGREPDEPAAAIQAATTPLEQTVVTTLAELPGATSHLEAPVTIVVGATVRFAEPRDPRPIVWVTRPIRQVSRLVKELADRHIAAHIEPTIKIAPTNDGSIARAEGIAWFVFTSRNGSEAFASAMRSQGRGGRELAGIGFACIGPATGEPLRPLIGRPDLVPEAYSVADLAAGFPRGKGTVAIVGGNMTDPGLAIALEAKGWTVEHRHAYTTARVEALSDQLLQMIERGQVRAVLLASAETARSTAELMRSHGSEPAHLPAVCLGPPTAEAARSEGFPVVGVAEVASASSLAAAARAWLDQAGIRP
ncbi:MAG: uroporphyrinogen-III C-methyltransferase [Actinomycetota bacterium]